MEYNKIKRAILKQVKSSKEAAGVCSFARILWDHHRQHVGNWRAKNRSTANRASMSVTQLLEAYGLKDTREFRILIARKKRQVENMGLFKWHKPWTPEMGETKKKLADEVEPQNADLAAPQEETPSTVTAVCSVVDSEIRRVWGKIIHPDVLDFLEQREAGLC